MEKPKKRREEESEEVRIQEALHEFQAAFESSGSRHAGPKAFVRGDVVNAEKGTVTHVPPTLYKPTPVAVKPSRPPMSVEQSKRIAEEAARKIMQQASKNKSNPVPVNRPPKPGTKKVAEKSKLSNLEIFKEELRQVQALRQERKGLRQQLQEKLGVDSETIDRIAPSLDNPYLDTGYGAYEDDPSTTNLYISNFPSDIRMEDIHATFGTFGPLASAKIIYPRPDDPNERRRDVHSGFAAFMVRQDAERALCAMDAEKLRGMELRVTWARPVTIPPVPFYVPITLRELAMPDPPSGLPFNARPLASDMKEFLAKHHELPRLNVALPESKELRADYNKMVYNSVVRVVIPTERPLLGIIHRVIEFLIREGPLFEAVIMAREKPNPVYRFLFDNHHPTHVYYRWKLYSVLQGDDRTQWRLDRFKMFDGSGPWWEPPPHSLVENGMPPQLYKTAYVPKKKKGAMSRAANYRKRARQHSSSGSGDEDRDRDRDADRDVRRERSGERSEKSKKWRGILDNLERDKLENIIRNLVPEKECIGDATLWCLEHAECAKEIVQCLLESMCIKETPLHKKIARFYLCSDILANCGVRLRDVFYFRQYFGEVLTDIFVALNDSLESIESRIKAEQFRSRVMLCFRMWEDNSIYPTDILIQMQNIFLGLTKPAEDEAAEMKAVEQEEDLDGEPIGVDENENAEDDIDGVPLEEEASKLPPEEAAAVHESRFTTSSWSQVDVEVEQVPTATTTKWDKFTGISKWEVPDLTTTSAAIKTSQDHGRRASMGGGTSTRPSTNSTNNGRDGGMNAVMNESPSAQKTSAQVSAEPSREHEEERRKSLREIEVKVVELQDELEADSLPQKRIEEEVARYRKKLMGRMEEKLGASDPTSTRSNGSKGSNSNEKEDRRQEEKHHDSHRSEGDRRRSKRSRSKERPSTREDRRDKDRRRRESSSERRRR